MRLLMIGGTMFLGRHVVQRAIESGHEVTIFTRGKHNSDKQAAERAMPGRVLTIRPGLIVGPHDPTDRFTYWPHRIARGGAVIAPGNPDRRVQIIDARDLAEWTLRMVEAGRTGVFNATGPDYQLTMRMVVDASLAASGSEAEIVWVGEEFLLERNVAPWIDLPLWLPDTPEYAGFDAVDCRKAFSEGLTFRSVQETVADTLSWDRTLPEDRGLRAGITRERESELLREWGSVRRRRSPCEPNPISVSSKAQDDLPAGTPQISYYRLIEGEIGTVK